MVLGIISHQLGQNLKNTVLDQAGTIPDPQRLGIRAPTVHGLIGQRLHAPYCRSGHVTLLVLSDCNQLDQTAPHIRVIDQTFAD